MTLFNDAMVAGDTFLIAENAEELSDEVMALVTEKIGDDFESILNEIREKDSAES